MKKLFFFRSQPSNNNQVSPPSKDKHVDKSRAHRNSSEDQVFGETPCLRRSLSFTSGSLYDTGKGQRNDHGDQNGSPYGTSYYAHKQSGQQLKQSRTISPERRSKSRCVDSAMLANIHKSDLSDMSSNCSSNVSSRVLDRYIDGDQQQNESNELKSIFSNNHFDDGNFVQKQPPRFQSTRPISPYNARRQKPKSQSFRATKAPQSSEWGEDGVCNESPRKLAKHVVERLSQSHFLPKMRSKEFDHDNPITIEDVYNRSLHMSFSEYSDEEFSDTTDEFHHEESSEFSEKEAVFESKNRAGENNDNVTDADLELFKELKEAEDRAALLLKELEREKFLQVRGVNAHVLIQKIRTLTEQKVNMAMEVSQVLQDRIAEKDLFKEKLKQMRVELESQNRRVDQENNETQLALEKQLDRRASEWSLKLEKYQEEEHRLRERVRELAEQNVFLQRKVSSISEKETDTNTKIAMSEEKLDEVTSQLKEAKEENAYMQRKIFELQEKCKAVEENRDCLKSNYEEKVIECKDMHRAVSRLQRTCTDQDKTIDGLRGLCGELENRNCHENSDFRLKKFQVDHVRLTGIEHALRKEVESYRVKVDSLRRENVELLNRLKSHGKNGKNEMFSTFKLDLELQNRISCLQSQMVPLLTDSGKLSRKLLDYVKTSAGPRVDAHDIVECEVKLQGIERAVDNLMSSTGTISNVLLQKSEIFHEKVSPFGVGAEDESQKRNIMKQEEINRSELKAETLLTSLMREKIYSDELEIEQLKAEVAAAVRCNDILKCEVQNAMDNFSCVNHKMKNLELQMMKKDEIINQLQDNLQESKKESAVIRGILPKITEERDSMWEELKQYSETNMLLESQINMLKKKIESLDEDILVKEGQISILKDSVAKPFDLLASPETEIFWKETSC